MKWIKWEGQQYIYLFLLIIALGFSGWLYMQSSFNINFLSPKTIAYLPDMMIEDLTVTQFDVEGKPAHYFHTPHLTHFPHKSMSQFTSPQIILSPEEGQPWTIRSDKGKAEDGSNKITLIGDVVFHQNAADNEKEKIIKTEEMTYYTKRSWATTQKKVFFEQPGLSVQSTGLAADLKKQQIYLLHQVSSIYNPNDENETL